MLENNPLVSVILPSFNRAYTLKRAIESVISQSYKNIELILIDDGSTDETSILVKEYQQLQCFYQENSGVSKARNLGLEKVQGSLIAFIDSDDEWLPKKIERQVEFLTKNRDTHWVHTNEIWIRNGTRVNPMKKHAKGGGDQFIPSLSMCMISPSTVMLKRELLLEFKGFREDYPVCEDYDLWLKLTAKYPVGFLEENLIKKYGGHEDQLSRKYFAMDYYRVKSLAWILENMDLSDNQAFSARKTLLEKSRILSEGYKKHNNLGDLEEISSLRARYSD